MRQASPWQSRIRRAALTTFTLTRTGALIVATEFDTKKEELDKTQTELDAAKDTVTKKQAELDEAKAADEAAKQKHEELVADIAAKQEEIDNKIHDNRFCPPKALDEDETDFLAEKAKERKAAEEKRKQEDYDAAVEFRVAQAAQEEAQEEVRPRPRQARLS